MQWAWHKRKCRHSWQGGGFAYKDRPGRPPSGVQNTATTCGGGCWIQLHGGGYTRWRPPVVEAAGCGFLEEGQERHCPPWYQRQPSFASHTPHQCLFVLLEAGRSLRWKKKVSVTHNFAQRPTGWWRLAVGGWRLVGGWRRLVVGNWWLAVVGRRWGLAAVGG